MIGNTDDWTDPEGVGLKRVSWSLSVGAVVGLDSVRRARARGTDPGAVKGPFVVVTDPFARLGATVALALKSVSFPDRLAERPRNPAEWWVEARNLELARPPLGSKDRPYEIIVPAWLEARAVADGTTCQEIADRLFRYATRVTVL